MMKLQKQDSRAFTLIELLVVITIISLLVSILLPSLFKAKDLTKRVVCASNLRRYMAAFQFYGEDNHSCYPTYSANKPCCQVLLVNKMVKVYIADDPKVVECPANEYPVPRSSFDLGWMRLCYFAGFDEGNKFFAAWKENSLIPDPYAVNLASPADCILMTDLTADESQGLTDAWINHRDGNAPSGNNRLYSDGHVEFVTPEAFEPYLSQGILLNR